MTLPQLTDRLSCLTSNAWLDLSQPGCLFEILQKARFDEPNAAAWERVIEAALAAQSSIERILAGLQREKTRESPLDVGRITNNLVRLIRSAAPFGEEKEPYWAELFRTGLKPEPSLNAPVALVGADLQGHITHFQLYQSDIPGLHEHPDISLCLYAENLLKTISRACPVGLNCAWRLPPAGRGATVYGRSPGGAVTTAFACFRAGYRYDSLCLILTTSEFGCVEYEPEKIQAAEASGIKYIAVSSESTLTSMHQVANLAQAIRFATLAPPEDLFYVPIREEYLLFEEIVMREHVTYAIVGPALSGKTTFCNRLHHHAESLGKLVALIEPPIGVEDYSEFLLDFLTRLAAEMQLPAPIASDWRSSPQQPVMKADQWIETHILRSSKAEKGFLLILDQAHRAFDSPIGEQFCGLLRYWHELARKSGQRGRTWRCFSLAVATAREPRTYSKSLNVSAFFNVTIQIRIEVIVDADSYINRHLKDPEGRDLPLPIRQRLIELTGALPVLLSAALRQLSRTPGMIETFLGTSKKLNGPFGPHLQYLLRVLEDPDKAAWRQALRDLPRKQPKPPICDELYTLGIIRQDKEGAWNFAAELYKALITEGRR